MERNIYKIGKELFITSDEEIKERDWYFSVRLNRAFQCESERHSFDLNNQREIKKIILTTDQELIYNGVQSIEDYFLEWFVKNPSCEEVEVEKWFDTSHINLGYGSKVYRNNPNMPLYKIIIPKEEIKLEDVFNDEKREGVKSLINEVKYLPKKEHKLTNICIKCGVDLHSAQKFICQEHPKNCKGIHLSEETLKERAIKEESKQDFILVKEDCACTDECMYYLSKQCKQQCKDFNISLQDCTCIEDTIDMKQETLEEAGLKHCDTLDKFPALVNPLFSFKEGAKWQAENSNVNALDFEIKALKSLIQYMDATIKSKYSDEDMVKFVSFVGKNYIKAKGFYYMKGDFEKSMKVSIHQILEQFKNK